jgi:hypothetical protein
MGFAVGTSLFAARMFPFSSGQFLSMNPHNAAPGGSDERSEQLSGGGAVNAVIGSDPDQLDQLAATMLACADRLDGVRSELAFVLVSSPWRGGDAEDFCWQWGHQLAGMLQGASAAFREAEARVRVNAAQQRGVSADDGASAPSGGRAGRGGWGGDGFDPLGIAAGFGAGLMNVLGYASGAVDLVKDAHRGLFGGHWGKNAADQIMRIADAVRVGDSVPLRIAGEFLSKWALPIDVVNTVIDSADFVAEYEKDPRSAETFSSGVSAVLGVAGVAAGVTGLVAVGVGAAPVAAAAAAVGGGLFVGGVAWELVAENTQVDEWVNDGLWAVSDGIAKAGAGFRDFIDGGLNGLLGR